MRSALFFVGTAIGWATAASAFATSAVDVVTQHNDNNRSGSTFGETALSPATVSRQSFGKLASLPIDDLLYAQPLYLHGVDILGLGTHDIVYIATVSNTLYAFDADTLDSTPLFKVSLGPTVPGSVVACQDMSTNVGITSTPTIDSNTGTIYVEARTLDSDGGQHHMLHALDVSNGLDVMDPVEIKASVAVAGQPNVVFDPAQENSRPGLLLANGNVYIAYASLCDFEPYHGWIFSYSASTLEQQAVFLTTPQGSEGGIWMGGGGLVGDSAGNIYASVGNGTMNRMYDGGLDISMAMARWTPDLQLADWFSPADEAEASGSDWDLGPCPTVLLEDQQLLIGGGKQGIVWVGNSGDLGHQTADDDQVEQILTPMTGASGWSGIATYPAPGGDELFLWGYGMALTAYQYDGGNFRQVDIGKQVSYPHKAGCPLSISADAPDAGPGIVWALEGNANNSYHTAAPGTLRAYSTSDLGTELWDSDMSSERDSLGVYAKFTPATIADGRVFAPTFSNQIIVYGLLPPDAGDGGELTDAGDTEDGGDAGGDGGDGGGIADAGPDAGDAGDAGSDAGPRDGGSPDSGSPDGGQASATTSTGTGGVAPPPSNGCGCGTTPDAGAGWWWAAVPLAALWLRRRRDK